MLINKENEFFDNTLTNLLPSKIAKFRNRSSKGIYKKFFYYSTFDNKTNMNFNFNSPNQKKVSVFHETNNETNDQTQTHSSSNIFKEVKVGIISEKEINYKSIKDIKSLNLFCSEKEKLKKIIYIQKWWKTIHKIIFIQKYVRSFLVKSHMSVMIYFIKNIYRILFKLVVNNIRNYNNNNKKKKKDNINNRTKTYNNKKIKKNDINTKTNKNNYYLFNESKNNCNKSKNNMSNKANYTNNAIKRNNKFMPNNNNKEKLTNKSKKINKEQKEKEINQNRRNKAQLLANNIYNLYNKVRKNYGNENNHNYSNSSVTLLSKNKENASFCNNNNKIIKKKIIKTGSMKNINEKKLSANININNNRKIIKGNKNNRYYSPNNRYMDSLINLLELKKKFLFWNTSIMKKIIIEKIKIYKKLNNSNNNKKRISIYNNGKRKDEEKSTITITKTISTSNSLIDLKIHRTIQKPNNIKEKNNSSQKMHLNKCSKKINRYIGIENNNSMNYFRSPKSSSKIKLHPGYNNTCSNNLFNNGIKIISQYNRTNEHEKKKTSESINKNIDINENKKIYYFYAIINLIENRNKRKKLKKYFHFWNAIMKCNNSFFSNKKIEEKIISFKSLKSPIRKNVNEKEQKYKNSKNLYTAGNNSYQTEAEDETFLCHYKANSILSPQELFTPNHMEKTTYQKFYGSSKIVYQKKFLVPKKMRNQSTNSKNFNFQEEDMNIETANESKNIMTTNTISNNLYTNNTYMMNNYDLNNTVFMKNNDYENTNNRKKEGRINEVCTTECKFHTYKNRFLESKKFNNKENESNNVNISIMENYKKNDSVNQNNDNSRINTITTKKISLKSRKYKNLSHSQEFRNGFQNLEN